MGTIGTPACMAIWNGPFLNGPRLSPTLRVPSGAIATDEVEHLLKGETRERGFIEGAAAAPGLTVGIATIVNPPANPGVAIDAREMDVSVEEAATEAPATQVLADLGRLQRLRSLLPDYLFSETQASSS